MSLERCFYMWVCLISYMYMCALTGGARKMRALTVTLLCLGSIYRASNDLNYRKPCPYMDEAS